MEKAMIRFIALCGYPKSGKSEVQRIISQIYGFRAFDDSESLREAAKILYGLTDWHVSTQEGKSSLVKIGDSRYSVRKVMGDLGCYLEDIDEFHFPRRALKICAEYPPESRFVFASVRRNQLSFFKDHGQTLIVEVIRNGCRPLGHFDEYSRDLVDISIENRWNHGDTVCSLEHLRNHIAEKLDPLLL